MRAFARDPVVIEKFKQALENDSGKSTHFETHIMKYKLYPQYCNVV